MINRNQKGFTLIELMIVIAIIGILAAIAIPNFISYRNKAFCSRAESDASAVQAAISSYFSEPNNVTVSTSNSAGLSGQAGVEPEQQFHDCDFYTVQFCLQDHSKRRQPALPAV